MNRQRIKLSEFASEHGLSVRSLLYKLVERDEYDAELRFLRTSDGEIVSHDQFSKEKKKSLDPLTQDDIFHFDKYDIEVEFLASNGEFFPANAYLKQTLDQGSDYVMMPELTQKAKKYPIGDLWADELQLIALLKRREKSVSRPCSPAIEQLILKAADKFLTSLNANNPRMKELTKCGKWNLSQVADVLHSKASTLFPGKRRSHSLIRKVLSANKDKLPPVPPDEPVCPHLISDKRPTSLNMLN